MSSPTFDAVSITTGVERRLGVRLDLAEHLEPADVRQAEIEQHQLAAGGAFAVGVLALALEEVERLPAVADDVHAVGQAVALEGVQRQLGVIWIVLSDQNLCG